MRIPGYTLLIAAALAAPACKKLEPQATKEAKAQQAEAHDKRIKQACASQASYERLKALAFEKAKDVHRGDTALLDRLAATTVVRMENPVVKSRDEALNVTVCKGRMVIELPPGAEDAFNGEHRLTAEVEYAAQAAADGSGLVYSLDGAEPIIYRLAAMDLKGGAQAASATPAPVPAIETAQASPAPALPSADAAPPPRPSPPVQPRRTAAPAEPPRPAMARPSFNCRYARSRSEQMICADERLAARDRAMASLYYRAIASGDPETRAILRDSRDEFLQRRERCGSPGCVAAVYDDRMDEIDRIASGE
ncbi:lysozyme inhibitor LprI family protein [Sphingomonas tabacisoli]|uniref:Lysozyme inhibitor LprI family protein n=1 Tax=Sphingomonas tabacisoli TaxID=2249466 RepID=A0ABW4I5R7_9SPHN